MPTTRVKTASSHVVKVTGMSEDLLALLDARVKQQHAAGRAEYIRELIRRDVLPASPLPAARNSEQQLLSEYHALVNLELAERLTPAQRERLREAEQALDQAEQDSPQAKLMFARLEETAGKLDQLLAAVRELPKAQG